MNQLKPRPKFQLYMKASGGEKVDEASQLPMFLHCIGDEALEIYDTYDVIGTDETLKSYDVIVKSLKSTSVPAKNIPFERYKLLNRTQNEGETINQVITELKRLVKSREQ